MKNYKVQLTEEEMKIVIAALENHKQSVAKSLKNKDINGVLITEILENSFEETSKIQSYLKYKLNESEKEAKEYERL